MLKAYAARRHYARAPQLSHPAKMHQATKKAAEAAFCPLTYCLRSRCRLALGRRLARVFLLELLDTASGIDNLLLAGIKRMAFSAHLNVNILAHRRARLEFAAAAANDV